MKRLFALLALAMLPLIAHSADIAIVGSPTRWTNTPTSAFATNVIAWGNVGIGDANLSGQATLTIKSMETINSSIALYSPSTSMAGQILWLATNNTALWVVGGNYQTQNALEFSTPTAAMMVIKPDGKVGIGTLAPSSTIDSTGGVRAASIVPTNGVMFPSTNGLAFSNGTVIAVSPTNNAIFLWNTNGTIPMFILADGVADGAGLQHGGGAFLDAVTVNSNVVNLATMRMRAIKLTNGAVNGYVLTSDANGLAAWAAPAAGGSTQMVTAAIGTLTVSNELNVTTLNANTLNLTNALGSNQVRLAITNLTDVSVPGRAAGDVLFWNPTMFKWTNGQPAAGAFSGNSNQIPFLNVAGTGFLFGSHDKSAPGFGMVNRANGNIGALLVHVDENEDIGLVQIGPPNPAANISTFVPSLSISNRYAGDGQTTQDMVRVNFVDIDGGSSTESFIQTWRSWVSGTPPASTLVAEAAKLRKDGKLSLGFGLSIQGGATLTNVLYATTNINFPSVAAGAVFDAAVSVPAAADGDIVSIGASSVSINATNGIFSAWASNAVVYIRCANNGLVNPIDPAAGVFKIRVDRFQ